MPHKKLARNYGKAPLAGQFQFEYFNRWQINERQGSHHVFSRTRAGPYSRASQSSQTPAIRPYLLRFIAHDGTRSVVAFANRDERDEQLLTLGASVTLATARGAI